MKNIINNIALNLHWGTPHEKSYRNQNEQLRFHVSVKLESHTVSVLFFIYPKQTIKNTDYYFYYYLSKDIINELDLQDKVPLIAKVLHTGNYFVIFGMLRNMGMSEFSVLSRYK